jgi:tetratricopeptide (TPR) repeat protein
VAMETSAVSQKPQHASVVDAQNPWPGLAAYTEELHDYFFGRSSECEELLRRVRREPITILFGASGLGKTSLLHAGLFPFLRWEGFLPIPIRLVHATDAEDLTEQVRKALPAAGPNSLTEVESLWACFHDREAIWKGPDGETVQLVLVFDQFEELFTRGQENSEARARSERFLTQLADLVEGRVPENLNKQLEQQPTLARQFAFDRHDYRVLLSLREDYLPHLESLRERMPSIMQNRMRLIPMTGRHAVEAVEGPSGKLLAAGVGGQIVKFVAAAKPLGPSASGSGTEKLDQLQVEPALLSLVCRELNKKRQDQHLPQITTDLVEECSPRILEDFYESCLADQPPGVAAFVQEELVTPDGHRFDIPLDRAQNELIQRGAPSSAIDTLVGRRLLRTEDRLGIERVELAHDVLLPVVMKGRERHQQAEEVRKAREREQAARAELWQSRRRLILVLILLLVALALAGAFWRERDSANKATETAVESSETAKKAKKDAVFALFSWPSYTMNKDDKDDSNFRRANKDLKTYKNLLSTGQFDLYLRKRTLLLDDWGRWLRDRGSYSEAEKRFKEALAIDLERAEKYKRDYISQFNLAVTYERLATIKMEDLDRDGAMQMEEQAEAQYAKIVDFFPNKQEAKNSLDTAQRKVKELDAITVTQQLKDNTVEISGELTRGDLKDRERTTSSCKIYALRLAGGKTYSINMVRKTPRLDPYLRLENAWGETVAKDDDSGYIDAWAPAPVLGLIDSPLTQCTLLLTIVLPVEHNNWKRNAYIRFACQRDGVYLIFATAFSAVTSKGPYLLSIQQQ